MAGGRLGRSLRRTAARARRRGAGRGEGKPPVLLTVTAALLVALFLVRGTERRLRPTLTILAAAQVQNQVAALFEEAVAQDLAQRQVDYGDLVTIHRDASGAITALTTQTGELNLLRAELVSQMLEALGKRSATDLQIPLGSLLDSELTWGRGPALTVRTAAAGTVSAEFESEFSAAGVNQTVHRIALELAVPMMVLLPGGPMEVPVRTCLPVAETVIVGQVPDTYLQLEGLPASG